MTRRAVTLATVMIAWGPISVAAQQAQRCGEGLAATISVDQGSPWRPPFGLDRVGARAMVHVQLITRQALPRELFIVSYQGGQEIERHKLAFSSNPSAYAAIGLGPPAAEAAPLFAHASLASLPSAVAVQALCENGSAELLHEEVSWPEIEAATLARPERAVNPVDLGAILPPHDWLLLRAGEVAVVDVAALSR